MAQLNEIVEKEKLRSEIAQCRKAYLYRTGGFLRAYEWSAWLFVKFVSDFKVSNRKVKSIDEPIAMIGFPPASMDKFTPEGSDVSTQTDGSVIIVFPSSIIPDNSDVTSLTAQFSEWKSALPVTESKVAAKEHDKVAAADDVPFAQHEGILPLTSIMQQILAYPIESKSPMESMAFLSKIRRQLSALI